MKRRRKYNRKGRKGRKVLGENYKNIDLCLAFLRVLCDLCGYISLTGNLGYLRRIRQARFIRFCYNLSFYEITTNILSAP